MRDLSGSILTSGNVSPLMEGEIKRKPRRPREKGNVRRGTKKDLMSVQRDHCEEK